MSPMGAPTPPEIRAALLAILEDARLLTLATVSPAGFAHASIAAFAFESDLRIRSVSPVDTEHSRNLESNPSAAVTVFDSRQDRVARRGAQLFGTMTALTGDAADRALAHFALRFPDVTDRAPHGSGGRGIYEFVPERAKVFDEERLIAHDYMEIDLGRGCAQA